MGLRISANPAGFELMFSRIGAFMSPTRALAAAAKETTTMNLSRLARLTAKTPGTPPLVSEYLRRAKSGDGEFASLNEAQRVAEFCDRVSRARGVAGTKL